MRSFRRKFIDEFLEREKPRFHGDVLDIGGERLNSRSQFSAPDGEGSQWTYINIDQEAEPDILASAYDIPLPDECADQVLMTEVLEHLQFPERALAEAFRLLRPGGTIFITMPFLYQVHGDPDDFSRWTPSMLKFKIEEAGFVVASLDPMGGVFHVIVDLVRSHLYRRQTTHRISASLLLRLLRLVVFMLRPLARSSGSTQRFITTGWSLIASKERYS